MFRKNKKLDNAEYVKIYKNRIDTNDIVSCYVDALSQMKCCSYNNHCNYIDMYNDLSLYEYKVDEFNTNQYE